MQVYLDAAFRAESSLSEHRGTVPNEVPWSGMLPGTEVATDKLSTSMHSHSPLLPCRLLSEARACPRSSAAGSDASSRRMEAANFSRSSSD